LSVGVVNEAVASVCSLSFAFFDASSLLDSSFVTLVSLVVEVEGVAIGVGVVDVVPDPKAKDVDGVVVDAAGTVGVESFGKAELKVKGVSALFVNAEALKIPAEANGDGAEEVDAAPLDGVVLAASLREVEESVGVVVVFEAGVIAGVVVTEALEDDAATGVVVGAVDADGDFTANNDEESKLKDGVEDNAATLELLKLVNAAVVGATFDGAEATGFARGVVGCESDLVGVAANAVNPLPTLAGEGA